MEVANTSLIYYHTVTITAIKSFNVKAPDFSEEKVIFNIQTIVSI
jgi:hypothetical protein